MSELDALAARKSMWLRHKAQGCAYCLTNRICGKAGTRVFRLRIARKLSTVG